MDKCRNCGEIQIKRPIYIVDGKPLAGKEAWQRLFSGNFQGISWKNLLLPDLQSFLIFGFLILFLFAYKHDIAQYEDIRAEPCEFCRPAIQNCQYADNIPQKETISSQDTALLNP